MLMNAFTIIYMKVEVKRSRFFSMLYNNYSGGSRIFPEGTPTPGGCAIPVFYQFFWNREKIARKGTALPNRFFICSSQFLRSTYMPDFSSFETM